MWVDIYGRAAKMFFVAMNEVLMIESQLVRECDNSSNGWSRQLGHDRILD